MASITPDERRALILSVVTTALTTAVTTGVQWLFHEAYRLVQARRDERAAAEAAECADGSPTPGAARTKVPIAAPREGEEVVS